MSLHRSLKTMSGALNQHRNVLTRAERIAKLSSEDRFSMDTNSALGIVKVRSIKASAGKKAKKAEEGETEGAATATAGAAGAKAGAGAAGAKPAAGAAKPAAGAAAKPAAGAKK